VVQRLVVHLAQTLRHRLDRLAAAVQHQPAQVALPTGALIGALKRREQVVGVGFQPSADHSQFGGCEATHSLLPCAWTGTTSPHTPPINHRPDRVLLGGSGPWPKSTATRRRPLRRLRAAFGSIEILWIVDHNNGQDQNDEPIQEGEQALPADPQC
jgi:hypothetical protein